MKKSTMLFRGLVVGSLLLGALPGQAQSNSCSLLKPADLNALLGGVAVAKPNAGACAWTAAGSSRKLVAARLKATGSSAEMAYAGARKNMGAEASSRSPTRSASATRRSPCRPASASPSTP